MRIIILEGASTSGKTRLTKLLQSKFQEQGRKVLIVAEDKIFFPILNKPDPEFALQHVREVLGSLDKHTDVVVFDRLHYSAAAVSNSDISYFSDFEQEILAHNPLVIFLKIDEDKLGDRVVEAMKHRGPSWKEHVNAHGNREGAAKHHITTQRKILDKLKGSKLRYEIIDATDSDYESIAGRIKKLIDSTSE